MSFPTDSELLRILSSEADTQYDLRALFGEPLFSRVTKRLLQMKDDGIVEYKNRRWSVVG